MNDIRGLVTEALMQRQKNNIPVRQPLSKLFINKKIDEKYLSILKEEINIKEILIDNSKEYSKDQNVILDLEITPELKREGDYRELIRKIKDLRKEKNLTPNDIAILFIETDKERIDFIKSFKEELKKDCKLSEIKLIEGNEEKIILEN